MKSNGLLTWETRIIYPFFLNDENDISKLANGWEPWMIIKGNSRHFDYIEKIFINNGNPYGKAFTLSVENADNIVRKNRDGRNAKSDDNFSFKRYWVSDSLGYQRTFFSYGRSDISDSEKKIDNLAKLKSFNLIYFKITKILLFCIDFEIDNINEYKDGIFNRKLSINRFFSLINVKQMLSDLTGLSDEVNGFHWLGLEEKSRFLSYSFLSFRGSRDNPNDQLLAQWLTDKNSVVFPHKLEIKGVPIYEGCSVWSSLEGCAIIENVSSSNIGLVSNDNIIYKDKNNSVLSSTIYTEAMARRTISQNTFYSYVLVLNQFFGLHVLKNKMLNSGEDFYSQRNKNLFSSMEKSIKNYSAFRSVYVFQNVSQVQHQQNVYNYFFKHYLIEDFIDEMDKACHPLTDIVSEKEKTRMEYFFKALTFFTISNIFGSISKNAAQIMAYSDYEQFWAYMVVFLMSILLLFIFVWGKPKELFSKIGNFFKKIWKSLKK